MEPAPFAPDETGRLIALRDMGLLDTPPERRFDRVTQLAARLVGCPIGILTLVDETRVFLKSVCGATTFGVKLATPHREYWFCSHVVASGEPVTVKDARVDPRFDRMGAVTTEPGLVSYAGVPLRGPQGHFVGTLAVLCLEPRSFSDAEVNALVALGKLVEAEFSSLPHSTIDALTGALNAGTFVRLGNRFLELADSRGQPSSVLRVDVRGMGTINARFGFEEGDNVLSETARLLGDSVRGSDLVGRVGPDEFAVLLCGAEPDATKAVADRLRVAAATHNTQPGAKAELAFQIGVSEHAAGDGADLAGQLLTAAMVADLELA